jgi:hypothetical protein
VVRKPEIGLGKIVGNSEQGSMSVAKEAQSDRNGKTLLSVSSPAGR